MIPDDAQLISEEALHEIAQRLPKSAGIVRKALAEAQERRASGEVTLVLYSKSASEFYVINEKAVGAT